MNEWQRFHFLTSELSRIFLLVRCLYNKQHYTWSLGGMDFHFSCSTRYLTRSLRLLEELQLIGDWTSCRTIQGVIVLVISNYSPDYSLNCTPLGPITIT